MLAACSECAGDYEDPDRTARAIEAEEMEDAGQAQSEGAEFPADS